MDMVALERGLEERFQLGKKVTEEHVLLNE